MSSDILDILYTPIDSPPVPDYNRLELDEWCSKNAPNQHVVNRRDGSKEARIQDAGYPWDIVYARNNYAWLDDFDIKFSALSTYFCSIFSLEPEVVSSIVFLPVKTNYTGTTYWHADPDEIGLRLYIENNETDGDFLLIKPTVEKYQSRSECRFTPPTDGISSKIQNVVHSAKAIKPLQAYYINNVRAVHAVNVEVPNLRRLAVLVLTKRTAANTTEEIKNLILSSAEQYPDFAIKWSS